MKKVLIIAYHFPPIAGPGSLRVTKFTKFLPEYGWHPTIVTTTKKNYWWYDNTLTKEIPKKVRVVRSFEPELIYLESLMYKLKLSKIYTYIKTNFIIPDESITWLPFAYLKSKKLLKNENLNLVFTTSPPPTSHIIGYLLKKHCNIPWIAEYRDLWTLNPEFNNNKKLTQYENKLEKSIIKKADFVIHISNTNKLKFANNFNINMNKTETIYNGYDIEYDIKTHHNTNTDVFTITYTGNFYGHRSPENFLKAFKLLIQENKQNPEELKFVFYGQSQFDIKAYIKQNKLENFVKVNDPVPINKLIHIYSISDVLLLILPSHDKGAITKKVFDYMATGKPILAIVPEGEIREILSKSGLVFFANPDSVNDIKNATQLLYNKWKAGKLVVTPNKDFINQFNRKNLTKNLAKIFNRVT